MKDETFFGLNDVVATGQFLDDKVQDRHLLLVREHAEDD